MEAVVDEALGDVLGRDPGRLLEPARVEDAFVRDEAVPALEEQRKMRREPRGDVVGVEDRDSRRGGQARCRPSCAM